MINHSEIGVVHQLSSPKKKGAPLSKGSRRLAVLSHSVHRPKIDQRLGLQRSSTYRFCARNQTCSHHLYNRIEIRIVCRYIMWEYVGHPVP